MKSKQLKQEEAKERQSERSKRTVREQLDRLDHKFGVGQGANKERLKLLNYLT